MKESPLEGLRVFSVKELRDIAEKLTYPEDSFKKFTELDHPLYPDYKDREEEMWLDRGFNLGVEYLLNAILRK